MIRPAITVCSHLVATPASMPSPSLRRANASPEQVMKRPPLLEVFHAGFCGKDDTCFRTWFHFAEPSSTSIRSVACTLDWRCSRKATCLIPAGIPSAQRSGKLVTMPLQCLNDASSQASMQRIARHSHRACTLQMVRLAQATRQGACLSRSVPACCGTSSSSNTSGLRPLRRCFAFSMRLCTLGAM